MGNASHFKQAAQHIYVWATKVLFGYAAD